MTTNKYVTAVSYNFFYFLISSVAYLALTPLAIRVMGEEFYGLWTILFAIGQFAAIGSLGIESIVNKFASEVDEEAYPASRILSSALLIVMVMAIIVAVILFSLRGILVDQIRPSTEFAQQFKDSLGIYALVIILQFLVHVFRGYFLSQILNRFVRIMDLVSSLSMLVGGILIAFVTKDLVLITLWNLLVGVLIVGIYFVRTRRVIPLRWLPTWTTIKRMMNFSVFMFIESSAINLFQQFDRILVAFVLGPVAAGIYTVATGVSLRMSMVAGNITEVLIPYASRMSSLGETRELMGTVQKVSRYVSLITALLGGLLIVWVRELLSVWISPGYSEANSLVFGVIIFAYGILSLSRPAHQALVGLGKVKFSGLTYFSASLIMLLAVFLLSGKFGLIGAAAANIVMVLLLAMNIYLYWRYNRIQGRKDFISNLVYGILPMALALVLVILELHWAIKLFYTLMLMTLIVLVLTRDSFLISQVRRFVSNPVRKPDHGQQ